MPAAVTRLILASASPARHQVLLRAGLAPEVIVSGVDESGVDAASPAELAGTLAGLKATAVADALDRAERPEPTLVIGCDSVLEVDGVAYGKPLTPKTATERWRLMRGRVGVLHTGHHLVRCDGTARVSRTRVGSTTVRFARVSDAEIAAYVATGEPLQVAGGFTLDGYGGAFVTGIDGDPHNVLGISLPLLRELTADLGVPWTSLWRHGADRHR